MKLSISRRCSVGGDGMLCAWDTRTQQCSAKVLAHPCEVSARAQHFEQDRELFLNLNRCCAVTGTSMTVLAWPLAPSTAGVCAAAGSGGGDMMTMLPLLLMLPFVPHASRTRAQHQDLGSAHARKRARSGATLLSALQAHSSVACGCFCPASESHRAFSHCLSVGSCWGTATA
jgi:hypothetical protein